MTTSTVWVTGARGFIGRHLAHALAAQGHCVAGVGHGAWPEAEYKPCGVRHWLNGAISHNNLDSLGRACGKPALIFHLAGGSSVGAAIAAPFEDFTRTVESSAALLEWLRQHAPGTKLVVASSAAVYGAAHEGAIPETALLSPCSPYGHHKAMMEALCRSYGASYGVGTAIVRPFSVYGIGLAKQLLWDLCSRMQADRSPPVLGGTGDELRDWINVRDVVRALILASDCAEPAAPVWNVGSGIATPVRTIAEHVSAVWHIGDAMPRRVGFTGRSRPGDPFSLVADPARLRAQGFACQVSVEQGIAEYVRWFQQRQGEPT